MTRIQITHPVLGEASVVATSLKVWEARGWTLVASDEQATPAPVDAAPAAEPAATEDPPHPMPS